MPGDAISSAQAASADSYITFRCRPHNTVDVRVVCLAVRIELGHLELSVSNAVGAIMLVSIAVIRAHIVVYTMTGHAHSIRRRMVRGVQRFKTFAADYFRFWL